MTIRNTLAVSTFIIASAITFAGAASASTGSLGNDIQSAAGSGHVGVNLNNGVAILFGGVETTVDENAAIMAAADFPGVERVISHIIVSN